MEVAEVWTWGSNTKGQLGHGDRKRQRLPRRVAALRSRGAALAIAMSDCHTLCLLRTLLDHILLLTQGRVTRY